MGLYTNILQVIPILMIIYYCLIFFCRKYHKTDLLAFPMYMYWATYPFIVNNKLFIIPSFTQILGILSILTTIVHIVKRDRKIHFNKYELLFYIVVCISWFQMSYSNFYYTGLLNLTYIFLLTSSFFNTRLFRNPKIIAKTLIINGLVLSFLAIIERLIYNSRVSTTFFNPNYLAIYLVFSLVILFFYAPKKKSLLIVIIFIAILLTESDAVIVGIVFPVLIIILNKFKLKITYRFIFPVIFISFTIGIIYGLSQSLLSNIEYFDHAASGVLKSSDSIRFDIWSIAISLFNKNPLIGIGYNQFQPQIAHTGFQNFMFNRREEGFVTHNDFVRILVELGLVGSLVFYIYIYKVINLSNKTQDIKMRMTYLSLVLILLFFSFTHNNINSLLFWMTLAFPIYVKI